LLLQKKVFRWKEGKMTTVGSDLPPLPPSSSENHLDSTGSVSKPVVPPRFLSPSLDTLKKYVFFLILVHLMIMNG
jgi:hypothetical protein